MGRPKLENQSDKIKRLDVWIKTSEHEIIIKNKMLPEIIQEMLLTTTSERQGRVIDHDSSGSMEKKKQEGYF